MLHILFANSLQGLEWFSFDDEFWLECYDAKDHFKYMRFVLYFISGLVSNLQLTVSIRMVKFNRHIYIHASFWGRV